MNDKQLHIVCLDVPYPPDYGGVIEMFYKIKILHEYGVRIHLHCFEYGRGEQPELSRYCEKINYYPRKEGHKGISHTMPYIVCSRSDYSLLENLAKDNHPILLEGIHCSYLLNDKRFEGRKILMRLHNVESVYYRQLYHSCPSLLKKIYYLHESMVLCKYEKTVANKACLLAICEQDRRYYKDHFGATDIQTLPVFLPFQEVKTEEGTGCYCLYHGNLSVSENEKAAVWLLEEVFNDLDIPFVIAGRNPSVRLTRIANSQNHTCLVADPSDPEMQDIIRKAQVNVLPSFNSTGVKLKLLNALFNGRHCIVNKEMVMMSGLEPLCTIASSAGSFKKAIKAKYEIPLEHEDICKRKHILTTQYNNRTGASKLIAWIW